ncbi:MAG: SufS family cysteine desulfurase [Bacteroidota bacterium]
MQSLTDIRKDFPLFEQHPELAYLDSAATSQKPKAVLEAIHHYYLNENANIHRGIYDLSMQATQAYESARKKVADFINAAESREIVFTKGSTDGINLVANSYLAPQLEAGDVVLISAMEHHANLVPWQQLCHAKGAHLEVIPLNERGEIVWRDFVERLSPKVKMLAFVHVSNSLGTINPAQEMIEEASKRGIPTLLDAAQSVAHYPLDVQALGCDFLVFSGHKVFGPTGIGILFGRAERLEEMKPYQSGGGMIRRVQYQETSFAPIPQRFEAGTPHVAGAIGLGAALDYVQSLDRVAVLKQLDALKDYATEVLNGIDGLQIIGQAKAKSGILSFVMELAHPHDIATILNEAKVAVRAGHHCTQPLLEGLGLPGTARASLSIYNQHSDIDQLKEGLQTVKQIFG